MISDYVQKFLVPLGIFSPNYRRDIQKYGATVLFASVEKVARGDEHIEVFMRYLATYQALVEEQFCEVEVNYAKDKQYLLPPIHELYSGQQTLLDAFVSNLSTFSRELSSSAYQCMVSLLSANVPIKDITSENSIMLDSYESRYNLALALSAFNINYLNILQEESVSQKILLDSLTQPMDLDVFKDTEFGQLICRRSCCLPLDKLFYNPNFLHVFIQDFNADIPTFSEYYIMLMQVFRVNSGLKERLVPVALSSPGLAKFLQMIHLEESRSPKAK